MIADPVGWLGCTTLTCAPRMEKKIALDTVIRRGEGQVRIIKKGKVDSVLERGSVTSLSRHPLKRIQLRAARATLAEISNPTRLAFIMCHRSSSPMCSVHSNLLGAAERARSYMAMQK